MTLLTDGDEIIAKVQAPRVEEVVEVVAEAGEGAPRARKPPRVQAGRRGATAERRVRRGLIAALAAAGAAQRASGGPVANTIGKRIVICSGRQRAQALAERRRTSRSRTSGSSSAKSVSSSNSVRNAM